MGPLAGFQRRPVLKDVKLEYRVHPEAAVSEVWTSLSNGFARAGGSA